MRKGNGESSWTLAVTSKPQEKESCTSHLSYSVMQCITLNSFLGKKNEIELHWLKKQR